MDIDRSVIGHGPPVFPSRIHGELRHLSGSSLPGELTKIKRGFNSSITFEIANLEHRVDLQTVRIPYTLQLTLAFFHNQYLSWKALHLPPLPPVTDSITTVLHFLLTFPFLDRRRLPSNLEKEKKERKMIHLTLNTTKKGLTLQATTPTKLLLYVYCL